MKITIFIFLLYCNFSFGQINFYNLSDYYYTNATIFSNQDTIQFALNKDFVNVAKKIFAETKCEKVRFVLNISKIKNEVAIDSISVSCSDLYLNLSNYEDMLLDVTIVLIKGSLENMFNEFQTRITVPISIYKEDFCLRE